jgi:hypothetical protein
VTETAFFPPPHLRNYFPGNTKRKSPVPGRVPAFSDCTAEITGSIHLDPDGSAKANLHVVLKGTLNPCYRQWAGEGTVREFVEEKLKRLFREGEVTRVIEVQCGPLGTSLTVEMTAPNAAKAGEGRAVLELPESVFLPEIEIPSSDRTLPFRFRGSMAETVNLTVRYPEGWNPIAQPSTFSGEVKDALHIGVMVWGQRRARDTLYRGLSIAGGDIGEVFPPKAGEKMATFRTLLSRWKARTSRTLVYETGK